MNIKKFVLCSVITVLGIFGLSRSDTRQTTIFSAQPVLAADPVRTDAVVLVNSASSNYSDFQHYIKPYLDNFGIPYTILDIATNPLTSNISDYAVIIIGHRSLDVSKLYLDTTEQGYITSAVSAGTGLVNFDNDLASGGIGYYPYIQTIFTFSYITPSTETGIRIDSLNYITALHQLNEVITTGNMGMAGITLAANSTALASSGTQPFLAITNYQQGRAVQWGTYSWISSSIKGPVYGLDDLVWRSIVWAARKPFVMQGMPPFVTMRVDDVSGPMWWANTAINLGYKPWMGLFFWDIDTSEAATISAMVNSGKATASVHALTNSYFFYYDHNAQANIDDTIFANIYAMATAFHINNNIPISKFVVPHFYEIGTNTFQGLKDWGVEFIGIQMNPGSPYGSNWLNAGPYRNFETGDSSSTLPVYYADYLTIIGHPEFANQFFNCVTEIRDDANYEWYPDGDLLGSINRGTRQTIRAFNSMVLATLFTHEYFIQGISSENWSLELEGVKANIESYEPIYVTMDYACQYVRAIHNSNISAGSYDPDLNRLTTTLSGSTDLATKFYVFFNDGAAIRQIMVDAPAFTGSTVVNFTLPGALDHIVITPASANVTYGGKQAFSAMGYDASNHPIPNLAIRWSVVNGGGAIDMDGVFTATGAPGNYPNTIRASFGGVTASASVSVVLTRAVVTGWNMVAVPVQAANMQLSVLFPDVSPPAYYFTTAYQEVQGSDALVAGRGYWMLFTGAHTYTFNGQLVSLQDIPVNAGWNMIGPFEHPVQVSAITSTPTGILSLPLYGYANGYTQADTLQPGIGYWAFATQAGTLHLGGGGGLAAVAPQAMRGEPDSPQDFRLPVDVNSGEGSTTVVLGVSPRGSARYDAGLDRLAPPPGPAGVYDVRLQNEGEDYLADVRSSQPGAYTFTLRFTPKQRGDDIVLKWDAKAVAGLGTFEIVDLVGGDLFVLDMSTTNELVIHPGSVLYSGLQIRATTHSPAYLQFMPLLVH
jgi:hypothetical protein